MADRRPGRGLCRIGLHDWDGPYVMSAGEFGRGADDPFRVWSERWCIHCRKTQQQHPGEAWWTTVKDCP